VPPVQASQQPHLRLACRGFRQRLSKSQIYSPMPQLGTANSLPYKLFGWHQAYNPSGYSIDTNLPSNCSLDTWRSLGCLQSLTNLTLTGSLPGLPDSWAGNGSFPTLQTMNFSMSGLTGSLPNSWAQPSAFPALQTMNFSVTSLTGTLPISWAESSAFPNLTALYLQQTNITGHSVCLCFGKCTRFMLSTSYTVHLTETLCLVKLPVLSPLH